MDLRRTRAHETHIARQQRGRSLERRRKAAAAAAAKSPRPSPSPSPRPSPSPSPKPCPAGKVRNPASNRCVKRGSRALLFSGYYNGGVPLDFLDCAAGKVYSVRSGRCVDAARSARATRKTSRKTASTTRKLPLDPRNKNFAVEAAQRMLDSRDRLSANNVAFIEGTFGRRSPTQSPVQSPVQSPRAGSQSRDADGFAGLPPQEQHAILKAAIELMESAKAGRALTAEEAQFVANVSGLFR